MATKRITNKHYYKGVECADKFHLSRLIYRDVKTCGFDLRMWRLWRKKFNITKQGFKLRTNRLWDFIMGLFDGDPMVRTVLESYNSSYMIEAHDKLKEILNEKGAYEVYLENIRKSRSRYMLNKCGTAENVVKLYLMSLPERTDMINRSFCWSETPQGHTFWCELDRTVQRAMYDIIIKYSI